MYTVIKGLYFDSLVRYPACFVMCAFFLPPCAARLSMFLETLLLNLFVSSLETFFAVPVVLVQQLLLSTFYCSVEIQQPARYTDYKIRAIITFASLSGDAVQFPILTVRLDAGYYNSSFVVYLGVFWVPPLCPVTQSPIWRTGS